MICGALWPDAPAPDGGPVTCHLDKGHGGMWHRWDHENHVTDGEPFGDGSITWHTTLGRAVSANAGDLTPTLRGDGYRMHQGKPVPNWTVDLHPTHVWLHEQMPPKPVR